MVTDVGSQRRRDARKFEADRLKFQARQQKRSQESAQKHGLAMEYAKRGQLPPDSLLGETPTGPDLATSRGRAMAAQARGATETSLGTPSMRYMTLKDQASLNVAEDAKRKAQLAEKAKTGWQPSITVGSTTGGPDMTLRGRDASVSEGPMSDTGLGTYRDILDQGRRSMAAMETPAPERIRGMSGYMNAIRSGQVPAGAPSPTPLQQRLAKQGPVDQQTDAWMNADRLMARTGGIPANYQPAPQPAPQQPQPQAQAYQPLRPTDRAGIAETLQRVGANADMTEGPGSRPMAQDVYDRAQATIRPYVQQFNDLLVAQQTNTAQFNDARRRVELNRESNSLTQGDIDAVAALQAEAERIQGQMDLAMRNKDSVLKDAVARNEQGAGELALPLVGGPDVMIPRRAPQAPMQVGENYLRPQPGAEPVQTVLERILRGPQQTAQGLPAFTPTPSEKIGERDMLLREQQYRDQRPITTKAAAEPTATETARYKHIAEGVPSMNVSAYWETDPNAAIGRLQEAGDWIRNTLAQAQSPQDKAGVAASISNSKQYKDMLEDLADLSDFGAGDVIEYNIGPKAAKQRVQMMQAIRDLVGAHLLRGR